MAIVTKSGESFFDPTDPTTPITTAYGVVDGFGVFDKAIKQAEFTINVYRSQAARDAKANILSKKKHVVRGNDFDTYFSCAELCKVGVDMYTKAYEYALQDTNQDGSLKWEQFESDE